MRLIPVMRISSPMSAPSSGAMQSASHSTSPVVSGASVDSPSRLVSRNGSLASRLASVAPARGIDRVPGFLVQPGTVTGVTRGGIGDDLVGEQVGACALRRIVFGCGDEEFTGCIEVVGIPSGAEHSLSEDQVDVLALADAEAYP